MNDAGLTWVLLAIAFAAMMVGRFVVRRFTVHFRPIAAYEVLPLLAADVVESNRRLHFGLGFSALGQTSTITALVGAELIYRMTARFAIGGQTPILTLSSGMTLPLAQDTLRRAYVYRQNADKWHSALAVWFPAGRRSLAYGAGAASLAADAQVDANVMFGHYGSELALIGESAIRLDQRLVAHSDVLEGQAVAFAQADSVLIGEELYAGPAYMDGSALQRGGLIALETLRWLVILAILVEVLLGLL